MNTFRDIFREHVSSSGSKLVFRYLRCPYLCAHLFRYVNVIQFDWLHRQVLQSSITHSFLFVSSTRIPAVIDRLCFSILRYDF